LEVLNRQGVPNRHFTRALQSRAVDVKRRSVQSVKRGHRRISVSNDSRHITEQDHRGVSMRAITLSKRGLHAIAREGRPRRKHKDLYSLLNPPWGERDKQEEARGNEIHKSAVWNTSITCLSIAQRREQLCRGAGTRRKSWTRKGLRKRDGRDTEKTLRKSTLQQYLSVKSLCPAKKKFKKLRTH